MIIEGTNFNNYNIVVLMVFPNNTTYALVLYMGLRKTFYSTYEATFVDNLLRVTKERISSSKETYTVKHPRKNSYIVSFSGVLTHEWGCRGRRGTASGRKPWRLKVTWSVVLLAVAVRYRSELRSFRTRTRWSLESGVWIWIWTSAPSTPLVSS